METSSGHSGPHDYAGTAGARFSAITASLQNASRDAGSGASGADDREPTTDREPAAATPSNPDTAASSAGQPATTCHLKRNPARVAAMQKPCGQAL